MTESAPQDSELSFRFSSPPIDSVSSFVLLTLNSLLLAMASLGENLFLPGELKSAEHLLLQFLVLLLTVHLWGFPRLCSPQHLTCIYSGTVAGAREAFLNDIPAISLSYDWVRGRSSRNDCTLAAKACLPIISAVLIEIKKKTYPRNCFLNIDVPTDVVNHKGYRLTAQGKSLIKMGWRQVTSDTQGRKMLSTMTMDRNSSSNSESVASDTKAEHLLFRREVRGTSVDDGDKDYTFLQDGYITVTPLGALSPADMDSQAYFEQWLPGVTKHFLTSAL